MQRIHIPLEQGFCCQGFLRFASSALCLSFVLLTSAEMIGGSVGMGYYVKYYSDFGDYTRILAGIIVIGVVITFISTLLNGLQRYLTRWK